MERRAEGAKAWVLLVDDEPELLRGVARSLKVQGYSVTEARNGEEAVQCLSRRAFDVGEVLEDSFDRCAEVIGYVDCCHGVRSLMTSWSFSCRVALQLPRTGSLDSPSR